MADVHVMKFTVTGFEVSHGRHAVGHNASSATTVRLALQGATMSEANRPVKLALISFTRQSADSSGSIGIVDKFLQSDHDYLAVSLPAADFDEYWKILTLVQHPHLRCVTRRHSTAIEELTLSSAEFHPGEGL